MLPETVLTIARQMTQGPVVVLTGAGLSTASGIPAYRDRDGQWQHAQPIQHQEFLRAETVRRRYWARSFVGWPIMGRAAPNAGHHVLATLEQQGRVSAIITQNVDGLHAQAGSRRVVELHGSIGRVRCLDCGASHARAEVQAWMQAGNAGFSPPADAYTRPAPDGDAHLEDAHYAGFRVPDCPACGGMLKPDVVFFGDNVPRDRVAEAMQAVEQAAALLVVGSSLMVYSGYRFAEHAHRLGRPVLAINQGVTRADALLGAKLEVDCSEGLEAVLAALRDMPPMLAASAPDGYAIAS